MWGKIKLAVVAAAAALFFAGCSSVAPPAAVKQPGKVLSEEKEDSKNAGSGKTVSTSKSSAYEQNGQEKIKNTIDVQKVKPNEAGQVMVLMYHSISEPEGEWARTPDNFRRDLNTLYEKGYRPISLKDYAAGNIITEAGYTPVVITFDDGWQNNFNLIQDAQGKWVIDPNSAVGILEEFHRKHADFPLEATFFVNDNIPFGQKEHLAYKLKYIVDQGMDIGNHTATHVNFVETDKDRIEKEVGGIVKMMQQYLPNYEVNTMALPFGSRPKDKELYTYLEKGVYEGVKYQNRAILNVGWDPDKSPFHKDFNPLAIHRVRVSELEKYVQNVGMYSWLDQFDKGNRSRYISDGDPDAVTVPEKYKDRIDTKRAADRKIILYTLQEK